MTQIPEVLKDRVLVMMLFIRSSDVTNSFLGNEPFSFGGRFNGLTQIHMSQDGLGVSLLLNNLSEGGIQGGVVFSNNPLKLVVPALTGVTCPA